MKQRLFRTGGGVGENSKNQDEWHTTKSSELVAISPLRISSVLTQSPCADAIIHVHKILVPLRDISQNLGSVYTHRRHLRLRSDPTEVW